MTSKETIMIALMLHPDGFSTEDAKLKAAARKLQSEGKVRIETYSANKIIYTRRYSRLQVREGYHITLR